MKHFIRGPMLVLFFSSLAFSQIAKGQGITLGVKTGVNLNQFSQPGSTIGVSAGAYGSYDLLPFLTLKLEPQYSQEGGARPDYVRDYSAISDNIQSIYYLNPSVNFHNLLVPLLAEFTLPEFKSEAIMPKLILGGSYAATIMANETYTKRYTFVDNLPNDPANPGNNSYQMDVAYRHENVTSNYIRNQWSLIAGFGLQFKAAKRDFSFDVRYRQGINNLNQFRFSSPSYIPGTGGKLYSSSLSFNLSVSLFKF